jgi:WD40 repeat protein/serine/threonine protein kinase
MAGQTVKGYELRDRIGGGGFGEVYRAFQPLLKREVAIKIILPQHANQPEFIRRFEVEAELVARLEHPHIVPLYDYWRDPTGAYLVMRLIRGGSLEDAIEMGPLGVELTASILDQVAGALSVAHRNGVVHRDLKPANILLDEDKNAYLADFGIAKDLGAKITSQTMEGLLTPNYAAPEQFKGEEITLRTDLYNLGLMLFEMLTGRPPFSGALHEVIFKHISDPIPSVREFQPDLPPAIDEVLQRATAKNPDDRFQNALALAAAFKSALASAHLIDTETAPDLYEQTDLLDEMTVIDDTSLLENPYKGLRAFREGDADDFFGRDDLVKRLLSRMDGRSENGGIERFLAVVGPSGSGKSSVVKAGLIPALRRGALRGSNEWFITEMYPSAQPMAELEAALLRVAINPPQSLIQQLEEDERGLLRAIKRIMPADDDSELVLIIDQFEELFTQIENEKLRVHFLNNLRAALEDPKSRLRIIVTIRADFYDRPLQYEALGELMRRQTEVVLPLSAADLERAISGPAERVGVTLEPGLAQAIIEDVGEQPGTLPLLQYALTELFERRTGRLLTLEAYTTIGGVTGALARRAEELYRGFDAPAQEAARQLFLRLVTLGEGTEDTRRRVRRAELGDTPELDRVIETFGHFRLLTFDRDPITRGPTVEVAHEALIRTWERLRDWIAESREDLRIQRRLTSATAEWLTSGRNPDFLASGTRLDQFEEWSRTTALTLNADERAYLETSIHEQAARRARDEAIARRVQNLGRATAVLVVMIVIAIIATGIFLNQAATSQSRANEAQTQVALAGETLTPIPNTLTPVELTLAAGNAQLATAANQVAVAQAQIDNVGQTLTPAQGTAIAAQNAAQEANYIAATAQARVESVGATLTPQQATIAAAQGLVENVGLTLTPVQATVQVAQAQVENVGLTLTPVQGTVIAAQSDALRANVLAGTAQAQVDSIGATLTPQQATVIAAQELVVNAQSAARDANVLAATAQARVESVGATLTPQQATVVAAQGLVENVGLTLTPVQATVQVAQAQVENVGLTLTPVQATVIAAEIDARQANALAGAAQTQVAEVGITLTPIIATVAAADNAVAQANQQAATAQAQVDTIGATLTPQQATIAAAQAQVENVGLTLTPVQGTVIAAENAALAANQLAGAAQTQVAEVAVTLTPIIATVAAADNAVAQANQFAATAQAQVENVGATLTPQQATVAAAQAQVENVGATLTPVQGTVIAAENAARQANQLAGAAQTQVADAIEQARNAGATLTPQQATIVAAQAQVENVGATLTPQQATIAAAQAQVENVGLTLTPAQATVAVAQAQLAEVGATLTPQQATIAAAQAQVENVGATLTPQQATVIAAQALSDNVGLTLTPQQATIAAAQAQVENVGATLTPVQATVIAARNDADSISLAVSAEQAISNGNYDLALALVLESIRLNPNLTQPQRLLNQIAFNSPRLSFTNVHTVRFAPTSRLIALAEGSTVSVWNMDTRQQVDQLEGHSGQITDMAFSPNGQFLATASVDATAIIWDVSRWPGGSRATQAHRLAAHGAAVNAVTFNPDSTILLTGADDTLVISWDVRTGTELRRFAGQPWPVKQLRFAEGGRDFFAWTDASGTRILNLWNGLNGARIYSDEQRVFETFSPNMRNAFLGGNRTPLQIYNAAGRSLVREFVRGFNWTTDTATNAIFRPFAGAEVLLGIESSTGDNRLVLADVATGEVVRQFQGDAAQRVNGIAFNPDGTLLLSGNGNQLVLWDVAKGIPIRRLTAHNDLVDTIEFSPDGRYAMSISRDNNVRLWDITSGDSAEIVRLRIPVEIPPQAPPHWAGFNPFRNTVHAGVWISLIEWSVQNGRTQPSVSTGAPILRTIFSPKEARAITILENSAVLWNLDAGSSGLIDRIGSANDLFSGAGAYSPNGDYVALDGRNAIYVYDMATRQRIQNISKPPLPSGYILTSLAISSDGQRVIGSTGNPNEVDAAPGDIIVWDVASGQEIQRFPVEHTRTINSVAISPDGLSVLTASDDNLLILWNLELGLVVRRFAGHTDDVNVGLFSVDPARPFILSASDDGTIILWDLDSAQPIRRLQGHIQPVKTLNLSPDGQRMVSATAGDTLIVWRVQTPQEVIDWVVANRYVKPFTADECNQYNVRNCNVELLIPTPLPARPTEAFLATPTPAQAEADVTATPIPAALKSFAVNTGSQNVNVRSSDSRDAPIVDVLRVNERAEILGLSSRGTGWYQIILPDGRLAWVSGSVISIEGNPGAIPMVDPPPIVQQPTRTPQPSTGGTGGTGGTGAGTGGQAGATEAAPLYDCSRFRLTSPIGYINRDSTTFYWDPLPGVQATYWLAIFNERGQNVALANAGSATSVTINTSPEAIGDGFVFSYEVNVFVDGQTVCPASGSVGQRPAS